MEKAPVFTCPECGEKTAALAYTTRITCPGCGNTRMILTGLAPIPTEGDGGVPAITLHTLIAEIEGLEKQREALMHRWGLIDLFRNIGLILIMAGSGYVILSTLSSLSMLIHGAYAMLGGILIHGVSQLVGNGYYIQKAFLQELIIIKQKEIEQHKTGPIKSGNIPL